MARNVLTLTMGGDTHAAIIDHGLRKLGCDSTVYLQTSAAGAGDASIEYSDSGVCLRLGAAAFEVTAENTFWDRRNVHGFLTPADLHPDDVDFTRRMLRNFFNGARGLLDKTFAVNPSAARDFLAAKPAQLKLARLSGLRVPATLISNDVDRVRDFIRSHDPVCVKSFGAYTWQEGEESHHAHTYVVDKNSDLPDESIRLSPMIYQAFVRKAYEVRVTVFGRFVCATKIGMGPGVDTTDWRVNLNYLNHLEPIDAPEVVRGGIFALMKRLGLRFGTFDFIVDPEGAWTFIEVNESGQFLWQEEYCPTCIVAEPFCRFLESGRDDFQWRVEDHDPAFAGAVLAREAATTDSWAIVETASPSQQSLGLHFSRGNDVRPVA